MQSSKGHAKWIFLKFHSLRWIWNGKVVLEDACVSTKRWMFECFQTAALSLWRAWLVSTFQRAKQKKLIWAKKRFYKWAEYGSGSSLYIHRLLFQSDLCWTGFGNPPFHSGFMHTEKPIDSISSRELCRRTEMFFVLQHSISQTPPTRILNWLQAEESCLRLCGPALNRIIESNVHFKQRFVI